MPRNHTFDIDGMLQTLEEQQSRKFDVLAPQQMLTAENTDGTPTMKLQTLEGNLANLPWSRYAGNQIANKLGIPAKHFHKMEDGHQDELVRHMNYWLQEGDDRRLVRCIKTPDDPTSDAHIRAFLSDRYKILDNLDVATTALTAFAKKVQERGGTPEVFNWQVSEKQMDFLMIDTTVTADLNAPVGATSEARTGGHGDVTEGGDWTQGMEGTMQSPDFDVSQGGSFRMAMAEGNDGRGGEGSDLVYAGVHIKNDETGGGGLHVMPCALRAVCNNRLLVGQKLSIIHLGRPLNEDLLMSRDLIRRENALTFEKIAAAVEQSFDPEVFEKLVDTIRETKTVELPSEAAAADIIIQREGWSEDKRDALLSSFGNQRVDADRLTAFDAMNAITHAAQAFEAQSPETCLEMEEAAAALVGSGATGMRSYFGTKVEN